MKAKFFVIGGLVVFLVIVLAVVYLKNRPAMKVETDLLSRIGVSEELFFISDNQVWAMTRPSRSKKIFDWQAVSATGKINSILPSFNRDLVAVLIEDGEVIKQDILQYFRGDLKLYLIDSTGAVTTNYSLFQEEMITSLAYFWKDKDVLIRASLRQADGNQRPFHWRASAANLSSLSPLSASEYDRLFAPNKSEIVFSDFIESAYRKSNQTIQGDRVYADRNLITRQTASETEVLADSARFFGGEDILFNTFQIAPDEKKIAFNKDVDRCLWGSEDAKDQAVNELYIYDLKTERQVRVAADPSPLNFIWLDENTLAFDQGLGNSQEVFIFDLRKNQAEQLTDNERADGLFFFSQAPRCD